MRNNILFVGLDYAFTGKVAIKISEITDMFFLDVNKLIEYSLIDIKNVEVVCGVNYLNNQKKSIAQGVAKYENTISNFPQSLFLTRGVASKLKQSCVIVYIKLPKNKIKKISPMDLIVYDEINETLQRRADIVINCQSKNIEDAVGLVVQQLQTLKKY